MSQANGWTSLGRSLTRPSQHTTVTPLHWRGNVHAAPVPQVTFVCRIQQIGDQTHDVGRVLGDVEPRDDTATPAHAVERAPPAAVLLERLTSGVPFVAVALQGHLGLGPGEVQESLPAGVCMRQEVL